MKFHIKINRDGIEHLDPDKFQNFAERRSGTRAVIVPLLPESQKMRRYLFGAVYPLLAYLDEKNYKDHAVLADIHEACKQEFNGEMVFLNEKPYRIGKSTKGNLGDYIEKVISFMEEQYGIDRTACLNPATFLDWRDRIYPTGQFEFYIDYLRAEHKLPLST